MTSSAYIPGTSWWRAPSPGTPVRATVSVPGSKSMTNRALVLSALATEPSRITGALLSRDTSLMVQALRSLGCEIDLQPHPDDPSCACYFIRPTTQLVGGPIDCGLAGTVMRFIPPIAAMANGRVYMDGDPHAGSRPMGGVIAGLQQLGVNISGSSLPLSIEGSGEVAGGEVTIDASASSQFVSGLLMAAPRYHHGLVINHAGGPLPSTPHITMTVEMLREAGAEVDTSVTHQWTVHPGPISGHDWEIEPDLSNATPFIAAAMVTGGVVRIRNWPIQSTQAGDAIRYIVKQMGARIEYAHSHYSHDLIVHAPPLGQLRGINLDMSDIGELTPTVAAMAALASDTSSLTGIGHLRGHETDRLSALADEINGLGGHCSERDDGLIIEPRPLRAGTWHSYADHRMATAGAIIGLVIPGVLIDDIDTTSKTLPNFDQRWHAMLKGE
ncbi:3-phosphoshikimate 1-carboxyvinyltransferase [Corynebacterium sp. ES2794-CONJ1]|uniref:3-phosphoshikimate 1-carboxyvinyltransferase n=1 Tax=unclassified Corynebacterium TaxID=2624378 RepID=UPI00216B4457|nr:MULTISPECIES: 3-phosphoshikimate 1-carboxyvinyltransferase [unclassified Corynebacterium]MCS4531384.1 3-phosphoshikimate 1-carboxyvinyltransferase [Corynebacterium sp. ES2730-CONJ]MCU9518771.1 3-phosphoshikimate 1-carboxyvinyltransferase [Corynebacterium sp. ES2794-CONJ1]